MEASWCSARIPKPGVQEQSQWSRGRLIAPNPVKLAPDQPIWWVGSQATRGKKIPIGKRVAGYDNVFRLDVEMLATLGRKYL